MSNEHDLNGLDLVSKMLTPLLAISGPIGKGVTFALALLRTAGVVMRDEGAEADEIIQRVRTPRTLKTREEISAIVDARLAEERRRPPPLPNDASITRNEKPKSVRPPGKKE